MIVFEDFTVGETRRFGSHRVTQDEIVAFARRFDAQDFHVDPEAAKASFVGGLIASGWHSCSLTMRLMAEGFILDAASMGSPGIEEMRWLRPVLPGTTVTLQREVLDMRASRSRPGMGLVKFRFSLLDDGDRPLAEQVNWIMFGRRGHALPLPRPKELAPPVYVPPAVPELPIPAAVPAPPLAWFDEVEIGGRTELGSFRFSAEEIVAFAKAFDPQPFHVDEAAAKVSSFGGLCASGWHTAGVWMMLMLASRAGRRQANGPRLGSSPGFRDLRWLKPVFAGDVLSYSSTVTDKRASNSRPGWGLVFHRNAAVNQHGEEVFSFDGCVFWERRGASGE